MSAQIHFRISTRNDEFPVDEWLKKIPSLVDYYLGLPRLTCCDFQAGYCIDVGGKRWNGDQNGYDFDEPWMTLSWLDALGIIFGSKTKLANVHFWEQSTATVKRIDEDILEIEDMAAHAGGGVCAPAWVNANEFAEQIIRATQQYLELCERLKDELVKRGEIVPKEKMEKIIAELDAASFRQKLEELEEVRRIG